MRLPNGEVLMHAGKPYDPVKAHAYYERTKKLKGRTKGAIQSPNDARKAAGVPAVKKPDPGALAKQKIQLRARVTQLRQMISEMQAELKKRIKAAEEAAKDTASEDKSDAAKAKAEANRAAKEAAKPDTAAEKAQAARDAKKYRDKNQQQLKSKASSGSGGSSGSSTASDKATAKADADKAVTDLKATIESVQTKLAAATAKLRAL